MKIRPSQVRAASTDERHVLVSLEQEVQWLPDDGFGSLRRMSATWSVGVPALGTSPGALPLLAYGIRILSLSASQACRIRFYATVAHRDRDRDRPHDVRAEGNHGVLAEFIFSDEGLVLIASPAIDMANMENPPRPEFAYNLTNTGVDPATVKLTMVYHEVETRLAV